ncbi:transcriptional activator, TenA family [Chytriomyces sp. MP71]|nr:transcriptional activator, TenA family [Chytriomyces sp. MP71]
MIADTSRFSAQLRASTEPAWSNAVNHRFVRELLDGSVPAAVLSRYLIQDHRFLDSFLALLGAAMAHADTFAARIKLGKFVGAVSGDENTYFERSFVELGVSERRRTDDPDTGATAGFKSLMLEAAMSGNYAAILSVLCVAEWLYLSWALTAPAAFPKSLPFVNTEWVELHRGANFEALVAFLRSELDRVGPAHQAVCKDFFSRSVQLELAFFDSAYAEN